MKIREMLKGVARNWEITPWPCVIPSGSGRPASKRTRSAGTKGLLHIALDTLIREIESPLVTNIDRLAVARRIEELPGVKQ